MGDMETVTLLKEQITTLVTVAEAAHSALDTLLGDTDPPGETEQELEELYPEVYAAMRLAIVLDEVKAALNLTEGQG